MMADRQTVRNVVEFVHSADWPETLAALMTMLTEIRDRVPEAYRGIIETDFDHDGYAGGPGCLKIFYHAPETDAQMAERTAKDVHRERDSRAREMATLARLKSKYET